MKALSLIAVVGAGLLLAGCPQHMSIGSVAGGECKVMERPEYEVRGVAVYDQRWIDRQIEGGVGACKWPRPAQRPAELDQQPAVHAVRPAPRPGLLKRLKAKAKAIVRPAAVTPTIEPVPASPAAPPADPAPPPCARVDQLLHRCGVPPRIVFPK
jgi:hypothetical protein